MTTMAEVLIAETVSHWLAVAALLTVWLYYRWQVRQGRIQAIDFWDRSGIRLFIVITPNDIETTPSCRKVSGTAMLARDLAHGAVSAAVHGCRRSPDCRCQYIGLYGGWPEAQTLYLRLLKEGRPVQLTVPDLYALLQGEWQRFAGAEDDRLSVHMLKAMLDGVNNLECASYGYQYVINQADKVRDLGFVVPAYVYKTELLLQCDRLREAKALVTVFWQAYRTGRLQGATAPTPAQLARMKRYQAHLAERHTTSAYVPFEQQGFVLA